MNKILIPFSLVLLLGACKELPQTDEACFYHLKVDPEHYTAPGVDNRPYRDLGATLVDEYASGQRQVPPVGTNGELVFADRCELLESENFVSQAFVDSGFKYEILSITGDQYEAFVQELSNTTRAQYEAIRNAEKQAGGSEH